MDNVEIKKSNLEAAYKQADDNTKKTARHIVRRCGNN